MTVRGAVSIGRRLQDPLSRISKNRRQSLLVLGQYQHDVDQTKLQKSLETVVVELCKCCWRVNLNTASKSLLSYVSGIGPKLAENVFSYRNKQWGIYF